MRIDIRPVKFIGMGLAAGITLVLAGRCGPPSSGAQAAAGAQPADTDSTRLASGSLYVNAPAKVVDGPFVLTDAVSSTSVATLYQTKGICPPPVTNNGDFPSFVGSVPMGIGFHGSRIYIPAGSFLCTAGTNTTLSWSGFRPY